MERFGPSVALPNPGDRVVAIRWAPGSIDDNITVPPGTRGTVTMSNELNICVKWDNGSNISLLPVDEWRPE